MTKPSFTLWSIGNKIDEAAGRLATVRRAINLGYETNISADAESLLDLVQIAMEREEESLARLSEAMMEILRNQKQSDQEDQTKRQWVNLTDDEVDALYATTMAYDAVRVAEKMLKEKNT